MKFITYILLLDLLYYHVLRVNKYNMYNSEFFYQLCVFHSKCVLLPKK